MDPVIAKKADMDRERREKAEKAHAENAKQSSVAGKQKNKSMVPMAASVLLLAAIGVYGVRSNALDVTQISAYLTGVLDKAVSVTGRYLEEPEDASEITENTEVNAEQAKETQAAESVQTTEPAQGELAAENEVQPPAQMEVVVIPDPETLESAAAPSDTAEETQAVLSENVVVENTASEEKGSQEYLIKQGDNLLRILRSYYGDESKLAEICDINNIVDPDNIQVGQTILLP